MPTAEQTAEPIRPKVKCVTCGHVIFDGAAIKSRVVILTLTGAVAKCRCKKMVAVPARYSE